MTKVNDFTERIPNYVSPEVETIVIELEQGILSGSGGSDPSGSTDPWEDGN